MPPAPIPRARRAVPLVVTVAVLVAGFGLPTGSQAAVPLQDERPTPLPARMAAADPVVELPRTVSGDRAVRLLGEDVDQAAALNSRTTEELVEILEEDATAWLDTGGRLYHREPAAEAAPTDAVPRTAAAPLSETFRLHSNPGSTKKIYLDFDGATVAGTGWNDWKPLLATTHPAWDPADDGPAFSDSERQRVQAVWAAVSEDFAPFDVDVTTEDPGRSGYGSHALVSPSSALDTICGGGCGGIAYVGTFGNDYYAPAWVFPQALGDDAKNIAEAVSHEVGHNLGLDHDGKVGQDYDGGYDPWAPIMGVGYGQPVSQWSKGDYTGASNQQDDLTQIRTHLGSRADEAPTAVAASPAVTGGAASGVIGSRTDIDTWLLGTCRGPVALAADVAGWMPDLDLTLTLRDAAGAAVASADPAVARIDRARASGLSASLDRTVAEGAYYVSVDGVGSGTWATLGYDDYGSLGGYTLRVTGDCDGVRPPGTPSAPGALRGTADPTTPAVTLTWAPPTSNGSSPVTGYTVTSSDGRTALVGAATTSHTFTGLQHATSYSFTVAASNAEGNGTPASVAVTTAPRQVVAPGAPETLTATWDPAAQEALVMWSPPTDDGGSAITGYALRVDGRSLGTFAATYRGVAIAPLAVGSHTVEVAAVNRVGAGQAASATVVVPAPVASTTALTAPRTARAGARPTVKVTVIRDGQPVSGRVVLRHPTGRATLTLQDGTARFRLPRLAAGRARLTASYAGDVTTLASSATATVRVSR